MPKHEELNSNLQNLEHGAYSVTTILAGDKHKMIVGACRLSA